MGSPGPSWASLGHLLGALERFLGASWTLLGSSGLVLSVFFVHRGSRGRPDLDFGTPPTNFEGPEALVLEDLK